MTAVVAPVRVCTAAAHITHRRHGSFTATVLWLLVALSSCFQDVVYARNDRAFLTGAVYARGGATSVSSKTASISSGGGGGEQEAYMLLARAIRSRLKSDDGVVPEIPKIVKSFVSMSSAQSAFKGLDGAAHEAYQRTHSNKEDVDISVAGRALRSAARVGATADGLGACELCELVEHPDTLDLQSTNGTLAGREVLLNLTHVGPASSIMNVSVLVLFEPSYRGGVGINHGGIDETSASGGAKGRLIVVIGDNMGGNLGKALKVLGQTPLHVRLTPSVVTSEVASVQSSLYKSAGTVLEALESILLAHNSAAIHFVGRSLAGGVATLAASILDGRIPMPREKKNRKRRKNKATVEVSANATDSTDNNTPIGLHGLGKDRCSALTLGAPPCLSANVQTDFVTSILYGDDIVCRSSKESIDRFLKRTRKALKSGGIVGRQMNWMTDTLSLAASNLQNHAHGSEGEEARLSIPGRAYLIRPRRLGGVCSMHEVGAQLKGGRLALRAAVFWQLSDILLSKSLWKHHELDSYIHGLDRVQLRGLDDEATSH